MTDLVAIVVAALATWRVAAALYYENGPGNVWLKLRVWAQSHSPFLQGQISCFWCVTVWAGLLVWPLYVWVPWLLVPLALSGAAMLLSYGGRVIWRDLVEGG